MICGKCGKVLDGEDACCPRCGVSRQFLIGETNMDTEKKFRFEKILQQLVDDYDGIDIFSEENSIRLGKALYHLGADFSKERDALFIANSKKIPQRLYAVLGLPQSDLLNNLKTCMNDLTNSVIEKSVNSEMLSAFSLILYKGDICAQDKEFFASKPEPVAADTSRDDTKKEMNIQNTDMQEPQPIDNQDIRHWSEKKFYKNVYSSKQFREADLETKKEMRRASKEEAKLIKALRKDAGLGGGCYITTAICEASGKADDCHELTMMRKFRDEWLAKQPDGMYIINDYYETAPQIVTAINSLKNKERIYDFLSKNFLSKCIRYVEDNQMNDCKKCYMDMVEYAKIFFDVN